MKAVLVSQSIGVFLAFMAHMLGAFGAHVKHFGPCGSHVGPGFPGHAM